MRLVGLIVPFGCLVGAPQLRADRMNHGWDRGNHAGMTHQGGRHYDHLRHGRPASRSSSPCGCGDARIQSDERIHPAGTWT